VVYYASNVQGRSKYPETTAKYGAELAAWYREKAAAMVSADTYRGDAEAGDAWSQMMISTIQHEKEPEWLDKAVAQDYAFAHYMKATYSEPDWKMAAQELERAAQQGLAEAQLKLYSYYRDGYGVEPNQKKADALLAMAAANGSAGAQNAMERLRSGTSRKLPPMSDGDKAYVSFLLGLGFLAAVSSVGDSGETTLPDNEAIKMACPWGTYEVGDMCLLEPDLW